jgi:putative hydrolase of the HAD superfamily
MQTNRIVLVFDLDETLYDERMFAHSGFKAVARYCAESFGTHYRNFLKALIRLRASGSRLVFDEALREEGKYSRVAVKRCLSIYYTHTPRIKLDADARRCLMRMSRFAKYIVTDGNKNIQKNKIVALGIEPFMNRCFITHRFGIDRSKPSPYCFRRICHLERVGPEKVVYIADDPHKDFVGIKPLGFKTIRVLKGHHCHVRLSNRYEAHWQIDSLDQLDGRLLSRVFRGAVSAGI